jgi:transcriptional regulator with XRE-family HTH domain
MSTSRSDAKFERAYARGTLRSAFVSLFWAVITERRKKGPFTLQELAKRLGANKGEVSRWFKNDPNWTVNTIASIATALNLDLTITARDRSTGQLFTPAGPVVKTQVIMNPLHSRTSAQSAPSAAPAEPEKVTEKSRVEGQRPLDVAA